MAKKRKKNNVKKCRKPRGRRLKRKGEKPTAPPVDENVRVDKEQNQTIVRDAIIKLLQKGVAAGKRKRPTYKEIAEETGLHVNTVYKHCKGAEFKAIDTKYRVLTDDVILNMFIMTKKSAHAIKLWFQIIENWVEKKNISANLKGIMLNRDIPKKDVMEAYQDLLKDDRL